MSKQPYEIELEPSVINDKRAVANRVITPLKALLTECPRCGRQLTAANRIAEHGIDGGSVLICQCGYFDEISG